MDRDTPKGSVCRTEDQEPDADEVHDHLDIHGPDSNGQTRPCLWPRWLPNKTI